MCIDQPSDYIAFLLYLPRNVLLRRPVAVIKAVLPYLVLLGLFGGFVLWNGGVVLGTSLSLFTSHTLTSQATNPHT
jgi:hypothetical protein